MDITKPGILNIIILAVLSIPLDEEIFHFSANFIRAHPVISKLFIPQKTQPNNNELNATKEERKSKNISVTK
ncbi:MAG: hypothetical protein V4471_06900 [Pseudomonadota bacterium]